MAGDYDLGKASGKVVITADKRGIKQVEGAVDDVGKSARRTAEGFQEAEKSTTAWEKSAKKATVTAEDQAKAHEEIAQAHINAAKAAKERRTQEKALRDILKDENATEKDVAKQIEKKNKAVGEALRLAAKRNKLESDLQKILDGHNEEITTIVKVDTRQAKKDLDDWSRAWKKFYSDQARDKKKHDDLMARTADNQKSEVLKRAAGIGGGGGLTAGIAKTAGYGLGGTALGGLGGLVGAGGTGALVQGASSIAAAIAQMSGALATLPAALGAAATVVGTLQVATAGFADALKNLGEPDFEKGLKNLSQNARDAAWTLNALYPELRKIQNAVQDKFMANFAQDILSGFKILGPTIETTMNSIATSANKALQGIFDDLTSGQGLDDFNTFMSNTASSFDILSQAAQPFFEAFRSIMAVGSTFLPEIAGYVKELAEGFKDAIGEARDDNSLQNWIRSGIDGVKLFIDAIKEFGLGIGNVIKLGSTGGGFLGWLDKVAKAFNAWTSSASGQKVLTDFFTTTRAAMDALIPVLKPVGEAILTLVTTFAKLGTQMAPSFLTFFQQIATGIGELGKALTSGDVASSLGGALEALGSAFVKIVQAVGPSLPNLFAGLAQAFTDLAPVAISVAEAIANVLNSLTPDQIAGITLFIGAFAALAGVIGPVVGAITTLAGLAVALGVGLAPLIGIIAAITAALALFAVGLYEIITNFQEIVVTGVKAFYDLKAKIIDVVTSIPAEMITAGKAIVNGLIDGITSMFGPLGNVAKTMMQHIKDFIPNSPAKKGPFSGRGWTTYSGAAIAQGLADGIDSNASAPVGSTENMMGKMSQATGKGGIHDLIANLTELNDFGAKFASQVGDIAQTVIGAIKIFTTNPLTGDSILPKVYTRTSASMKAKEDADYKKGLKQTGGVEPGTYGASGPIADMLRAAGLNPTVGKQMGQGNTPGSNGAGTQGGATVPLIQKADGSWTSPDPAWAHLIERESSGKADIVQSPSTKDVNSGGNEAEGLFQITPENWRRLGADQKYGAASPKLATPQQQAEIAAQMLNNNPSGSDWGAGLSGREDPKELLSGLINSVAAPATPTAAMPPVPAAAANAPGGLIDASKLPEGMGNPVGLHPNAELLNRAVTAIFGERIKAAGGSIGGNRANDSGSGEHHGGALDIMVNKGGMMPNATQKQLGDEINKFIVDNADAFGLQWNIWDKKMNYPGGRTKEYTGINAGQGITGNHYDHVHSFTGDPNVAGTGTGATGLFKMPDGTIIPLNVGSPAAPLPPGPRVPGLNSVGPHGAPGANRTRPDAGVYRDWYTQGDSNIHAGTGNMPGPPVDPLATDPVQNTLDQIATNTGNTADATADIADPMLKGFLDQNSTLKDAINAASAPGATDDTIVSTLQSLDSEIAKQNALDTPQSRYMADQLSSQKSKIQTDTGMAEGQNPLDIAGQVASGATSLAGDVFKVIGSTLKAIDSAANIGDTLVRGIENTKDINSIIDNIQSFIELAADISKTVSDGLGMAAGIAGASGGMDGGAASGALSAASAVAGVVTSVLQSINAGIDLAQEAAKIAGKYVGQFLGFLTGGGQGSLMGDINFLLDTKTNELKTYSSDNPDDKRTFEGVGGSNADVRSGGIRDLNMYVGPGTDPNEAMSAAMWSIKTDQQGVYSNSDF
jgi:hypothetical protein